MRRVIAVPVAVVIMRVIIIMCMRSQLFCTWLIARPVEGHVNQTPGIEARQKRRANPSPECNIAKHHALLARHKRAFQNRILREEAGEASACVREAQTNNRDRSDQHRRIGEFLIAPYAAKLAHILLMMVTVNDRTCTKEQKRFKEGVRKQVEHSRLISANTSGKEHIAKLRTGRIRNHPFNIILRQANGRSKQCRQRANNCHHASRIDRVLIKR